MPPGSPRRKRLLIGTAAALLLAAGVGIVLSQQGDGPTRGPRAGEEGTTQSDAGVAVPATPAFRFRLAKRVLVPTGPRGVTRRDKRAGKQAATSTAGLLTDLYTEAFLDPANWQRDRYADAFRAFTGVAARQARSATEVLTAGPDAGARYEQILPIDGRVTASILLDRAGKPTVVVSLVRFRAKALGDEPETLRSTGQFFFERVGGTWRIVSFRVTRDDERREAA